MISCLAFVSHATHFHNHAFIQSSQQRWPINLMMMMIEHRCSDQNPSRLNSREAAAAARACNSRQLSLRCSSLKFLLNISSSKIFNMKIIPGSYPGRALILVVTHPEILGLVLRYFVTEIIPVYWLFRSLSDAHHRRLFHDVLALRGVNAATVRSLQIKICTSHHT